jgi:hypothetical protein
MARGSAREARGSLERLAEPADLHRSDARKIPHPVPSPSRSRPEHEEGGVGATVNHKRHLNTGPTVAVHKHITLPVILMLVVSIQNALSKQLWTWVVLWIHNLRHKAIQVVTKINFRRLHRIVSYTTIRLYYGYIHDQTMFILVNSYNFSKSYGNFFNYIEPSSRLASFTEPACRASSLISKV